MNVRWGKKVFSLNYCLSASNNRIFALINKDRAFICIQSNLYVYLSTESASWMLRGNFVRMLQWIITTNVRLNTSPTAWVGSILLYGSRYKFLTTSYQELNVFPFWHQVVQWHLFSQDCLKMQFSPTNLHTVLECDRQDNSGWNGFQVVSIPISCSKEN